MGGGFDVGMGDTKIEQEGGGRVLNFGHFVMM